MNEIPMSDFGRIAMKVALEAEAVVDFPITDVETSIPERFEQIATMLWRSNRD